MAYKNPEAEKAYKREWYKRNKEKVKTKARQNTPRYLERNRQFIRQIKESTPCTDCGESYPWYVMDFDHLSDKLQAVSVMARNASSITKLQAEIDKCEVVCANCHRTRTFGDVAEW